MPVKKSFIILSYDDVPGKEERANIKLERFLCFFYFSDVISKI